MPPSLVRPAVRTLVSRIADPLPAFVAQSGVPGWLKALSAAAVMGWDFRTDEKFRLDQSAFTRASAGWHRSTSGVWSQFAADVLRRTDRGALLEVARQNRSINRNAAPIDLTGTTKTGDAASTLTLVNDAAALAAAGLSGLVPNGQVYKLDNSAGVTLASVAIGGGTQNTNQHAASALVRGVGQYRVGVQNASMLLTAPADYAKTVYTGMPSFNGAQCFVAANAGSVVWFILNQLEEAAGASSPIVVAGSAATRAADALTVTGLVSGTYSWKVLLGTGAVQTLAVGATNPVRTIDPATLNDSEVAAIWAEAA